MAINTNYNVGTVTTEVTSQTTTEGQFRDGMTDIINAVGAINSAAISSVTVAQLNDVSPVVAMEDPMNENQVIITSNIVIGNADPPVAGTDFQNGQIYFTIE